MDTHPDPPETSDDQPMTAAEFLSLRESLGLSDLWISQHLGVSERTVRHWEQGKYAVPSGVQDEMHRLEEYTEDVIDTYIDDVEHKSSLVIRICRTDRDYRSAYPDSVFPARWHRIVAQRVAQELRRLQISNPRIEYAPQPETRGDS